MSLKKKKSNKLKNKEKNSKIISESEKLEKHGTYKEEDDQDSWRNYG